LHTLVSGFSQEFDNGANIEINIGDTKLGDCRADTQKSKVFAQLDITHLSILVAPDTIRAYQREKWSRVS
jgi:hypothetical protein